MENITLKDRIENETDVELRAALVAERARARSITGESLDDVRIGTVAEMGEAAGTCQMCTGEVKLREDRVATVEAVRGKLSLADVLIHEVKSHKQGRYFSEGFAELDATTEKPRSPVPAYRERVDHAKHLVEVIGSDAMQLAQGEDWQRKVLQAYVVARVQQNVDIKSAVNEGREHVKKAA